MKQEIKREQIINIAFSIHQKMIINDQNTRHKVFDLINEIDNDSDETIGADRLRYITKI